MGSLVAIRHVAYEDLDGFEAPFRERGYDISYRDAWSDSEPFNPLAPDILVVLGAPVGVYEARDYSFIAEEIEAVSARIAAGRPVLGICFGAQVMAAALGVRVVKGGKFEFGWGQIELTIDGSRSPIRHYAGGDRSVFHCHGDTFTLPKEATLLASTRAYANQAFALGPHLGIQFHGEVTERGLRRWYIGHAALIRSTIGQEAFLRSTVTEAAKFGNALDLVINEWLDSLTS